MMPFTVLVVRQVGDTMINGILRTPTKCRLSSSLLNHHSNQQCRLDRTTAASTSLNTPTKINSNDNNNNNKRQLYYFSSNATVNDVATTKSKSSNDVVAKKVSLALSVYFYQPELGMKDYEILSRASAFLLAVDAKDPIMDNNNNNNDNDTKKKSSGPYDHLEKAEHQRQQRTYQDTHKGMSPASGPDGRKLIDLNWLEFVPKEVRPQVHVICSSHVVSPFLWKEYYAQDWLTKVKQEHVTYTLEVINEQSESIAKFALNNTEPYHHPEGRDIALLHFKEEQSSIQLLQRLGIELLYLRHPEKLYSKGEEIIFDGYVVQERNTADAENYNNEKSAPSSSSNADTKNDDNRIFVPYVVNGNLSFHTNDRFFATTTKPLPEGLCGAPVLDSDGDCCGTVEGIVPITHANPKLAGSAAFLPSYVMKQFIDYVERRLVEQMMPKDLFQMVVTAKKTNSIGGGLYKSDGKGTYTEETNIEEAYDLAIASLKKRYSPDEVDAILQTVAKERDEVIELMNQDTNDDGNDKDMNEIIQRVRTKTLQIRELVKDQYSKQQQQQQQSKSSEPTTKKDQ